VSGGLATLQISGLLSANYVLEYIPSLGGDGNWTPVSSVTLVNNPQSIVDTTLTTGPTRFYRVRLVP
jgi:hypothetical protein